MIRNRRHPMNEIRFALPQLPPIAETPATFTVRPLTAEELNAAGGGVLIGLLLPAVQKVR